jgi:hypothetical protein
MVEAQSIARRRGAAMAADHKFRGFLVPDSCK